MTGDTPGLSVLAALLGDITPPPRYELHCGPGVITWLRLTTPDAEPEPPWSSAIAGLTGIPMTEVPELARGEWQILRDGDVTASGRIEIPDFVTRPVELAPIGLPAFTDRLGWRMAAMVMPPPRLSAIIGPLG
jgi:hypothetical protein